MIFFLYGISKILEPILPCPLLKPRLEGKVFPDRGFVLPSSRFNNPGVRMAKQKLSRPAQSTEELVAKLDTEILPLSEIELHPDNPRIHTIAQINAIAKLIESVGYAAGSMTIQKSRKRLCKGHGVYATLEKLGYTAAEFVVKDFTDEEALLFMIADNKLSELSSWNMPQLQVNFVDLKTSGIPLTLSGFTMKEIDGLKARDVKEDDPPPVSEEEPVTQAGDLWLLGEHRVLCGDSTKAEDVERVMNGEKAVLMATDPPYGDSWVQKAKDMQAHGYGRSHAVLHGSIESDDLSIEDLKVFLDKFLIAARIAGDPPFPLYVWHRSKRIVFEQALVDAGYLVHQPVIWVKPGFVIGRLHYHPRCEWALHGWLQGNGKCPFYGERNQSDVWEVDRENDKIHPTQKPVELFAIPIRNHTREGEICYEPFAGSGTQYIAADQLDRKCYGIEIAPKYCDVIIQRYINHVGTDEDVFVERDGDRLTWEEAQMPQRQKVHVC